MKLARTLAFVLSGLVVGIGGVEAAFRARDHGAFPHLNVYVADPALAVRLQPGATERISFSGNPVTSVRINAQGYRGEDWPANADSEIFIVGDSQAFGLGVEENDRFSAVLGSIVHRPVANAAVPTYGPAEYEAVLEEELPRRKPKTVVYVVNLANDLFEAAHPNTERHAVWDGWAVRKETAPDRVSSFPGRGWLYRDSHAFFALRRALHDGANDAGTVPSEGTWKDIATAGRDAQTGHDGAAAMFATARSAKEAELSALLDERAKNDKVLEGMLYKSDVPAPESFDGYGTGTLHAAHAQPGDIVRTDYGEGSSAVTAIAEQIAQAAAFRQSLAKVLEAKHDKTDLDALKRGDAIDAELKKLRQTSFEAVRARSPLRPFLERAQALCKANGAELVVLVLPLDVQVSKDEWAKYHAAPIDLSASRALADDVLSIASELGARPADAWPALAKAEPGAFLHGDLHMTTKGHAAVATVIVDALGKPSPGAIPTVPLGRSAVPTPDEWKAANATTNQSDMGSDLKVFKCKTTQVREWLRITCTAGRWKMGKLGRAESMITTTEHASTLVIAEVEGDLWRADVVAPTGRAEAVYAEFAVGDPQAYVRALTLDKKPPVPALTDGDRALAACAQKVGMDEAALYGAPQPGCLAYGEDCARVLACSRADDSAPPICAPGETVSGLLHRCTK